jgi:hypothetical protein
VDGHLTAGVQLAYVSPRAGRGETPPQHIPAAQHRAAGQREAFSLTLGGGKIAQPLHVLELDGADIAAAGGEPIADDAALQFCGKTCEGGTIEAASDDQASRAAFGDVIEDRLGIAREIGQATERSLDGRIELALEQRQHPKPDAVPREPPPFVAAVGTVAQAATAQKFEHVASRHVEQRPHDPVGALGMDADEPAEAAAPDQPMENGLGLIVERVPGCDAAEPFAPGDLGQKLVASRTSTLFEVAAAGQRALGHVHGASEPCRETLDEALVPLGIAPAQAMIDVSHRDPPPAPPELGQRDQECDGVGAAGHRYQHRIPFAQQLAARNRAGDRREERIVHPVPRLLPTAARRNRCRLAAWPGAWQGLRFRCCAAVCCCRYCSLAKP